MGFWMAKYLQWCFAVNSFNYFMLQLERDIYRESKRSTQLLVKLTYVVVMGDFSIIYNIDIYHCTVIPACKVKRQMDLAHFHSTLYTLLLLFIAQPCLTLCNPMDCSPPGSSVHGTLQSKNTAVGCHALFQGIFSTQGSNPHMLYWQANSKPLSHQGSPIVIIIPLFSIK